MGYSEWVSGEMAPSASTMLDEHRNSPGLLLALLGHEAMRRLRDAHTTQGLSPRQFHILGLLHDRGPLPQTELAVETDTAASVLVTQLNPLERDGLLARQRDPGDRRRHLVVLTDEGRERLHTAASAQIEVEDELFRSLTPSERAQLAHLLQLVRDELTGGDEHCASPTSLERKFESPAPR